MALDWTRPGRTPLGVLVGVPFSGWVAQAVLAPLFAHVSMPCYPDPGAGPTSPTLLPF